MTIQIGRAWANRLRNSPRPGARVTTTTAIATTPPSLSSPRLSRRGETSLGSGSGSATREAPLISAITGLSRMTGCGWVIGGCAGLASVCVVDRHGCALRAPHRSGGEIPRHVHTFGLADPVGAQLQCRDGPGRAEEYGGAYERDVEAGYSGCRNGAGSDRAVEEACRPACGEGREDREPD